MTTPHPKASLDNQRLQSVLHLLGFLEGKHGVDGIKGDETNAATRRAAAELGLGPTKTPEDMKAVETALMSKLKDAKFRENAVEKLKEMPEGRDSTVAMQVILRELKMESPGMSYTNRVMTGQNYSEARNLIEKIEGGQISVSAINEAGGKADKLRIDNNQTTGDLQFAFKNSVEGRVAEKPAPVKQQVAVGAPGLAT